MSLLQTRRHFVELSGRYDLITDDVSFADNGANKYIVAGQRWLDTTFEFAKVFGSYFATAVVGAWYALVPQCRSVHSVWMSTDANGKWKLDKRSLQELRAECPGDPADITGGPGLIYAIKDLRTPADAAGTTIIDKFGTTTYSSAVDNHTYIGIVWLPPLDVQTTLEVRGEFFQNLLSADGDKNYWTEVQPMVLAMASCMVLEMAYRNIQGVNDWESSVRRLLLGTEFDFILTEAAECTEMEG